MLSIWSGPKSAVWERVNKQHIPVQIIGKRVVHRDCVGF